MTAFSMTRPAILVHRVRGGEKFSKPKNWKSKIDISENVEEVETIKYVFDRFANTELGVFQIACELQRKGIRTRNGLEWTHRSLIAILQNPVYKGTMIYGKKKLGRFNWVGNGTVGGDGPVVIEHAHPAIIDEKTFDKAQRKFAKHSYKLKRCRDNDYILSGIMICGVTGKSMWGRRSAIGSNFAYYTAKRPKGIGSDACFSIRKDVIEGFVLGKMIELINQPELREHIRKAVTKRMTKRKRKAPNLKKLQKQLADLDAKIERATERILLVDSEALQDANRLLTNSARGAASCGHRYRGRDQRRQFRTRGPGRRRDGAVSQFERSHPPGGPVGIEGGFEGHDSGHHDLLGTGQVRENGVSIGASFASENRYCLRKTLRSEFQGVHVSESFVSTFSIK